MISTGTCQPCLHPLRVLGTEFYEGHWASFWGLSWKQPLHFFYWFFVVGSYGQDGVDLPIVGTSLYLGVGFIRSARSRQTCQTSVPRHPPPLGADAWQLLHVAYKGWVTSVQFIFIVRSIKSPFALLNLTLRMHYIPSQDSRQDSEPGLRARTSNQDFELGLEPGLDAGLDNFSLSRHFHVLQIPWGLG